MSLDDRLLNVIQVLYDAAMDETLWPQALEELTTLTNSQVASFWVLDASEQPRLPTFYYVNFDPAGIEEYLHRMAALDPTVQYLVRHPNQPIVHDGIVISEREKDRHPYYDWHERFSDTRFRLVGQAHPAPGVQAGVALHRNRNAGRFEPADIEQFTVLYPHLQRALAIGFRLGTLGTLQKCTTELLDQNSAAILLLDDRKRIVYANRWAEELRSHADGVQITSHGVTAQDRQENDQLQNLIARTLSGIAPERGAASGSCGAPHGGMMRVTRPSGKRPYAVLVTPVSRGYAALSTIEPAVCILIVDPSSQRCLPSDRLRTAFDLTEAEARLAALLAGGDGLRMASEKLGITYGTARVRLAEIFQKTETRRQGELIQILLTTLAPL